MKKSLKVLSTIGFTSALMALSLASCGGNASGGDDIYVGKTLYCSPDVPNGKGTGTESDPCNFIYAYNNAEPGTTIILKEGTYKYGQRLEIGKDLPSNATKSFGTQGRYITVRPEKKTVDGKEVDARVVFDFSAMNFDSTNRGIQLYSDYWYFYGIEVMGAGDNGMYIASSHNIIENCQFYNNRDTGLQIGRAYSDDNSIDLWPSYNLVKNCTSFANYDDETFGENADGYAAKLTVGYGNVFDGCIAFRNSDDGWDLFAKVDSGDIGTVVLYNCVSFENGFLPYTNDYEEDSKYGTYDTLNGDGIGFKLGGSVMKGNVIVNNCLSFNNKLHGVGDNSNPGVISVHNFTAVNNCAGLNEDGTISTKRGLPKTANKSNNIDLARSTNSYNNYYGIVSYVNNQAGFTTENDSEYNHDQFRGSTAYSIFNTGYDKGEVYKTFTGYEDASSWASDSTDIAYSAGTIYNKMNNDVFEDLSPINATCQSRADLPSLLGIHTRFRNADGSVNMGNKMKIKSEELLTYANGDPIGAQLTKEKDADYDHFGMYLFRESSCNNYTDDDIVVLSAYSIVQVVCNQEAVYQDFLLPKVVASANIEWSSDKPEVIEIDNNEEESRSGSVFGKGVVHVPNEETQVKITATITSGNSKLVKEFNLKVKSRNQGLGELVSTGSSAIRVTLYGNYAAPRVYPLDSSAITASEFPASLYTIESTYKYAKDRNSKFYNIDGVYTSVAGVYEVTAIATLKSNTKVKSSLVYRVYVVDPDASIDFTNNSSVVTLSSTGFDISGELSNIEGSVIALTSPTELTFANAKALLEHRNAAGESDIQKVKIVTDSIVAPFIADNSTDNGAVQYHIYYAVVNGNESAKTDTNKVYHKAITVKNITTKDDFFQLARFGKLESDTGDNTSTIYSLTNDLDFTGYKWNTNGKINGVQTATFGGLFRGNNHTISNLTLEAGDTAKAVNVFFKVSNGTVMDVKFDHLTINGDTSSSRQVGIIGDLQGGYVHNVRVTNYKATGYDSVGGVVGQVTGGINHVTNCSLVNPLIDIETVKEELAQANAGVTDEKQLKTISEQVAEDNEYTIASKNKYTGGIIGNVQKNNDQDQVVIYVSDCYASAVIGDGHDASGNAGLIVGRIKNEFESYETYITRCVAYGLVVSNGQYTAGIVGDFDGGAGYVTIDHCFADVEFIYQDMYLNAYEALMENSECQQYAHKNSNPIVGRAVQSTGIYVTDSNIGSWAEYYSANVISASLVFNLSNYEEEEKFVEISQALLDLLLKLDFEHVWKFENGKISLR